MLYPLSLKESKQQLFELKERYGYDNVSVINFTPTTELSEIDWIKMHILTPIENLKNGLEIKLESEEYETVNLIKKVIDFLENEDTKETFFELKNTKGKTKLFVKKKY